MAKFKIQVTNTHFQEHVVEADDLDHALEIGKEISDEMEADQTNFFEGSWQANPVSQDTEVTYKPVQEYLK